MKDLYARLDLSPDASSRAIESRLLEVDDPQLKRAVQKILLQPSRREVYDRNHRILSLIGELRAGLELNSSPNWQRTATEDFERTFRESERRHQKNHGRSSSSRSSASSSSTSQRESGVGTKVASAIGAILGGLGRAVLQFALGIGMFMAFIGLCAVIAWGISFSDGNSSTEPTSSVEPGTVQTENSTPQGANSSDDGEAPGELSPSEKARKRLERAREQRQERAREQSFDARAKPLPENGTWWKFTSEELIAPLRISVSEGQHYYVKLTDAITDERVLTAFIRSGRTIEVDVPTGSYNLKYAIGDTWYGRQHRFGPETEYLEANDTFNFEITGQRVRGHRIELIVQEGGNLSTAPIPESEF